MKILFVARAIDGVAGGVERMITTVMNALVEKGHTVDFLTWDLAGATCFYKISPLVTWHPMNLGNPFIKASNWLKLRRSFIVRKLVKQIRPDVIVCFQSGCFMAIRAYTLGMGIRVIAAERNAPTRFEHTQAGRYQNWVYQSFRLAERILVQCESYKELYPAFLRDRIMTIPNPVPSAKAFAQPHVPDTDGRFRILSVGRLGYQKNFPVLVEAFASISSTFPDWDLVILGKGEDFAKLNQLIDEKDLSDRIFLPGVTPSIFKEYVAAHLFCLPSRWEGFPNALAEAFSCGLPAIGFADCAGVRDLIVAGKNGLLASGNGDRATLAEALKALMASAQTRKAMGLHAIESVRQYEPDKIFTQWESVLAETANP